eukprot:jgi/Botrbrau1/8838/Bobra.0335s0025.1
MFSSTFTGKGLAPAAGLRRPASSRVPQRAPAIQALARPEKKNATHGVIAAPLIVAASATILSAGPSKAEEIVVLEPEAVDSAIGSIIEAVKAAGGFVKTGVQAAGTGLQYAKDAYDKVAPVVKDAADTASPYVKTAVETAGEVAAPAIKAAAPVVKSSISEAEKFLAAQGVNPKVILESAKQATSTAESAITQATPYAGGAFALYLLVPPLLRGFFGGLRGYRGDLTPASALDLVSNEGNVVLVDLRSDREKESGGIPELPSGRSAIELEYVTIADRKIRGQLRNPGALETTVTALEIAQLKRVSKGTTVLLLDKSGSQSKAVARELSSKGFRNIYVISGGFNAWTSAKLSTKVSSSFNNPEVLAPVFGTFKTISGNGRTAKAGSGKLKSLPSGR